MSAEAAWAPPPGDGLGRALVVSVLLHAALLAVAVSWRAGRAVDLPPTYQ